MEEIVTFIARDRPMAARRVLNRLREKADGLWALPESGRVVPELLNPIIYRVADTEVYVEVILDGRRDAESLLLDRLVRR